MFNTFCPIYPEQSLVSRNRRRRNAWWGGPKGGGLRGEGWSRLERHSEHRRAVLRRVAETPAASFASVASARHWEGPPGRMLPLRAGVVHSTLNFESQEEIHLMNLIDLDTT